MTFELSEESLAALKAWFKGYVATFESSDPEVRRNLNIKIGHTQRVGREILALAESLNLPVGHLRLAEAVALFHDLGRFPQFFRYGTLSDSMSVNHSLLGVKVLKSRSVLEGLGAGVRRIILCSVMLHNRAELPAKLPEACSLFARMIRDADKLDILKVMIEIYLESRNTTGDPVVLNLPNRADLSKTVLDDLLNKRIVDFKHLKTLNDLKILNFSYVFDINFPHTFRQIKDRGYLEIILSTLPQNADVQRAYAAARSHVDVKLSIPDNFKEAGNPVSQSRNPDSG